MKKPLPIGVDNFERMITDGYFYIDKTMLIKEFYGGRGSVYEPYGKISCI